MSEKTLNAANKYAWAALLCGLAFSAWAEEKTIRILAPWEAEGKMYQIGTEEVQFLGELEGIMYVDSGEGSFDTALFVCPVVHRLDTSTDKTSVTGHCQIVAAEGNVFGRFSCAGKPGTCSGLFEITSGTDDFEGITGSGEIQLRTALSSMIRGQASGSVVAEAAGLAVWPSLSVSFPGKEP
ncbi:MAG: hypothetical protein U9Q81_17120 [Pseudomonadota bacterium]|nr:hypothetical protein [Pseudomonadota bacterium]